MMPPSNSSHEGSSLDAATKRKIKSWVLRLRHLLQDDLGHQLRRLGIGVGHDTEAPPGYLDEDERARWQRIAATIRKEAHNEGSRDAAILAYVRESAYTYINRLVGLRCMEARDILYIAGQSTEVVTARPEYGGRSRLLWQMRSEDASYRSGTDAEARLWRDGLTRAFQAVTGDIRILFDPQHEYSQLFPSHRALMDAVRQINGLDAECGHGDEQSVFAAPDFLGWTYQFFNAEEKERIRDETGGKPRTSHELAVLNQFYTPEWIVKLLVDNTLGRIWLQMHPDTRLYSSTAATEDPERTTIDYLVTGASVARSLAVKLVGDLKLLDPACGTMHFGQYAFRLFYEMYLEEMERAGQPGWAAQPSVTDPGLVPGAILARNLYGIDIDARAIQIGALTLLLTAKEEAKRHMLDPRAVHVHRMNLIVADPVDLGAEEMARFLRHLDPERFGSHAAMERAVAAAWRNLEHVAELGSLVQVDEEVEAALSQPVSTWRRKLHDPAQARLSAEPEWDGLQLELSADARATAREHLLDALQQSLAESGSATDTDRRLFAQETRKGLELLTVLGQKYDAIVMNPPYGFVPDSVKDKARALFPRTYYDIYGMMVERALGLASGYVGALTSRTFASGPQLQHLRSLLLREQHGGLVFVDLGAGILDDATVVTCAYVAGGSASSIQFITVEGTQDKRQAFADALAGKAQDSCYERSKASLARLPGGTLAYSMVESVLSAFTQMPRLFGEYSTRSRAIRRADFEPDIAVVLQGVIPTPSDRFVRYRWEVEASTERHWIPLANGGDYSRYYEPDLYRLDWTDNGREIRAYASKHYRSATRTVKNTTWFFRGGLTYPSVSSIGFCARPTREGGFTQNGPLIWFRSAETEEVCLALLNSSLLAYCVDQLHPGRHTEVADVASVPIGTTEHERLRELAHTIVGLKRRWALGDEVAEAGAVPWVLQVLAGRANAACSYGVEGLGPVLDTCLRWEDEANTTCQAAEAEIDATIYDIYSIPVEDRVRIEARLRARPREVVWPQMAGKTVSQRRAEHVRRMLSHLVYTVVTRDDDGIVALVRCGREQTLLDRLRDELDALFGLDRGHAVESQASNELGGRRTLQTWLEKEYFRYHVSLCERRPICWHIVSEDGSFGAIVHYPRFTRDRLAKLRSHYLFSFIQGLQAELARLQGSESRELRTRQFTLERSLDAAQALDEKLRCIAEGDGYRIRVPWKSEADQPRGWDPDIEDGVKVNIRPFQEAGILAVRQVV